MSLFLGGGMSLFKNIKLKFKAKTNHLNTFQPIITHLAQAATCGKTKHSGHLGRWKTRSVLSRTLQM